MNEGIKKAIEDARRHWLDEVALFIEALDRSLGETPDPDPDLETVLLPVLLDAVGTFLAPGQAVEVGETPGRVVVRALGRDFFCGMDDVQEVLDMTARLQMYTSEPLA